MERRRPRAVLVLIDTGIGLSVVDLPNEVIHEIRRDRKIIPFPIACDVRNDFLESRAHSGDFEIVFRF